MRQVTMDKKDFQEIVEKNKKEHEDEFHEASQAFYKKCSAELIRIAADVREGTMNYATAQQLIGQMDCPRGYCDQYEEVLDQLEHEIGESVTLNAEEFRQYVKDEWYWKEGFAASYHASTGSSIQISK